MLVREGGRAWLYKFLQYTSKFYIGYIAKRRSFSAMSLASSGGQ